MERNDVRTELSDKELGGFAVRVATDHLGAPAIAAWLDPLQIETTTEQSI